MYVIDASAHAVFGGRFSGTIQRAYMHGVMLPESTFSTVLRTRRLSDCSGVCSGSCQLSAREAFSVIYYEDIVADYGVIDLLAAGLQAELLCLRLKVQ